MSDGRRRCGGAIIAFLFLLGLMSIPVPSTAWSPEDFGYEPPPAGHMLEHRDAYNDPRERGAHDVPERRGAHDGTRQRDAFSDPGRMWAYDDCARFIAGMPVGGGPLAALQSRPAWVRHARFFDRDWEKLDEKQFQPVREWAERELEASAWSTDTVFYPFSGPDFVNVFAFFPRARTYVLVALEPPGEIPDFAAMSDAHLNSYFTNMKKALSDLVNIHFFVTAHMKAAIQGTEIKGVLPVLLFMMARNNVQVLDVQYWSMKPDGTVLEFPAMGARGLDPASVQGLRITFEAAGMEESRPQTLYYFCLNLYNQPFERNRHFLSFLKDLAPFTTFMKSASYVMFDPYNTSAARQFMLDQSRCVVQEDSGIPLRYFNPALWDFQFYGVYEQPIRLFRHDYQRDLARIYDGDGDIGPLPFGFGYHFKVGRGNLMVAEKKPGQ